MRCYRVMAGNLTGFVLLVVLAAILFAMFGKG